MRDKQYKAKPQPSHTPEMVCIARANRMAIQKVLPTRNLRIGHTQDAGGAAVCPKSKTQRGLDNQYADDNRQGRRNNGNATPKQKIRKGAGGNMNTIKHQAEKAPQEPCRFEKRLGSTLYLVNVHFSETSTETMKDKILRLVKSEAQHSGRAAV